MLRIQEFIECFDDITEACVYLKRNLAIESNMYGLQVGDEEHQVFLLRAGQKADMTDPLVQEANCLILYPDGDVLARAWSWPDVVHSTMKIPVNFNLAGSICEEVPDGKVVVIYNIEGSWVIGTDISVDGSEYLSGMELPTFTYETEIKNLLSRRSGGSWFEPFEKVNPMMCFVFNYVNPYAKRVMPILMPELYLTGVMNLESGHEVSSGMVESLANQMDFTRPFWKEVNGSGSLGTRVNNMRTLSPGLMMRDINDHRVFIPNPIYKAVKDAKDAGDRIRPAHIAKILRACRDKADVGSIKAAYQDFGPMLELLWSVRGELVEELIMLWSVAKIEPTLKDFAKAVQHHPLNYLLFMVRNCEITDLKEEVAAIKPIKLTRIAEKRWEKEYGAASRLLKFAGGSTDGVSEEEEGSITYCREGD